LDVTGVCCAGVGVGRIREAFTVLVGGKAPLYHKVPRVAPMPINGTRIKSAVMKSTLRAERFDLEERGFGAVRLALSISLEAALAPVTDKGNGGTVVGQAGVPGGK
jgi:hypothetical protein